MSHLGSIGQIVTSIDISIFRREYTQKNTLYTSQWRVPRWRRPPVLTVSRKKIMNHFGDLKKTLKSNQGVKGLQILSFECESCPLVQVFLCLYKKGASSARVCTRPNTPAGALRRAPRSHLLRALWQVTSTTGISHSYRALPTVLGSPSFYLIGLHELPATPFLHRPQLTVFYARHWCNAMMPGIWSCLFLCSACSFFDFA